MMMIMGGIFSLILLLLSLNYWLVVLSLIIVMFFMLLMMVYFFPDCTLIHSNVFLGFSQFYCLLFKMLQMRFGVFIHHHQFVCLDVSSFTFGWMFPNIRNDTETYL